MNIELHIEQLVLRGLHVKNRLQLAQAVQRELTRLLSDGGLSPVAAADTRNVDIPQVRAPGFQVSPAGGDEKLATQVAHSTYGALIR